jgi:hypothetical protein
MSMVLFAIAIQCCNYLIAVTYGSSTAVSVISPSNITGPDNAILEFGYARAGFSFQDSSATCSWYSVFPVEGPVSLKGGTLDLATDFKFNNPGYFADIGRFRGANHVIDLSQYTKSISAGALGSSRLVLTQFGVISPTRIARSVSWSYDGQYVAITILSGGGNELLIYSYNGTTLTLVAGADLGANGFTVRWHPNSYYLAVTAASAASSVRTFLFTPPSTLSAALSTIALSTTIYAASWQQAGNYLAVGGQGTTAAQGVVYVYRFNNGTGVLDSVVTPTDNNTTALNGSVQYEGMRWAPRGNRDDLIVGTNNGGTAGSVHMFTYTFTSLKLDHVRHYNQGKAVNTVDFAPTSTYIAAGCADGTLRSYQHSVVGNGTITQKYTATLTGAVNSIRWKPDATELAVGRDLAATNEFQIYAFDTSSYALTERLASPFAVAVNAVSYYVNTTGSFIARLLNVAANGLAVLKESYSPFSFKDTVLALNGDITLSAPLTFEGNCAVNARHNTITFTGDGAFNIAPNGNLEVGLSNLKFTTPTGILLENDNSTIKFRDAEIVLSSDMSIDKGTMDILGDLTITGPHTFEYSSKYTSTIRENASLTIADNAVFSVGKMTRTGREPLAFEKGSSELNLNNATLKISNYGMNFNRGRMNVNGACFLPIDLSVDSHNTFTLGDGILSGNDPSVIIQGQGSSLAIDHGIVSLNSAISTTVLQFYGQSQLELDSTTSVQFNRSQVWTDGWVITSSYYMAGFAPNAKLILNNMRFSWLDRSQDYYLTGTRVFTGLVLDKDDKLILNPGTLYRDVYVKQRGNILTGAGNVEGNLYFTDKNSSLTWDVVGRCGFGDINLNGGRIAFLKDSGLVDGYSFKGSGSVDIGNTTFDLNPESVNWMSNIYWIGNGGKLRLNHDLELSGIWTFSGNVTIDGGFVLDLGSSGTIILERGAQLTIDNTTIYNVSRHHGIACRDDNATIILNFADFVLSGDYLFDTGSIFNYWDSKILALGGPDTLYTFSYMSKRPLSIDAYSNLNVKSGICLTMGRLDSTVIDPTLQPILFGDSLTSLLNLDGGSLRVTSSGMIMTKGILQVRDTSILEVLSDKKEQGLIMGDATVENDFILKILPGVRLTLKKGKLVYNNYADDGIVFGSNTSEFAIESQRGLSYSRNMLLNFGSITTPFPTDTFIDSYANASVFASNLNRYDYGHLLDFYVTGTLKVQPNRTIVLDTNDQLIINSGNMGIDVEIVGANNKISGMGNLAGNINLTDAQSSLTWDLIGKIDSGDIYLKGGRITFLGDSGFTQNFSFKTSGTIDLTNRSFDFAYFPSEWDSNIYWIGNGATLRPHSDITLSGIWTFSGDISLESDYTLDFNQSGSLILERGAKVGLNGVSLWNVTRQNGLVCSDNNCEVRLNFADFVLSGDYLFDKGSLFVYWDSKILSLGEFDTIYTFSYESTKTSTIDAFAQLTINPATRFSIGRRDSSITDPLQQPLVFIDPTSSILSLDGGTLHVTSSGMQMTSGIVQVKNTSALEIESQKKEYGLILGDNTRAEDLTLKIDPGARLSVLDGKLVYNNYDDDHIIFGSQESSLDIQSDYALSPITDMALNFGSVVSPDMTLRICDHEPDVLLTTRNVHRYDYAHQMDFFITGSILAGTESSLVLDSHDKLMVSFGVVPANILIKGNDNKISGVGEIGGNLVFTDANSSLTWDMLGHLGSGDIDLKGGRITFMGNSSFNDGYSFKGSGTVDLVNKRFDLGPEDTVWDSNIYWAGTGATLGLNGNVTLSGIWTFSGDVVIDGKNYLIDLAPTGTIIIERGSRVTFKDFSIYNLSRQTPIVCMDNASQLVLNVADLLLADDYIFDKGSIFVYYNSTIGCLGGLDVLHTFSYTSPESSTIDSFAYLRILPNTTFSIGRQDSSIIDPTKQPLLFNDAETAQLQLYHSTLHVTSSGMILTNGMLNAQHEAFINVDSTQYDFGLVLGTGLPADDFQVRIDPGATLKTVHGFVFYNNYSPDRFIFDSTTSVVDTEEGAGFWIKRDLTLSNGVLKTPAASTLLFRKDDDANLVHHDITRVYNSSPYSLQRRRTQSVRPYGLGEGDYYYVAEGYSSNDVVALSGISDFGGAGSFGGSLSISNHTASLRSSMINPLFCDVALNGGTYILMTDGAFAGDKTFTGSGTIQCQGTQFTFGPHENNITSTLYWQGLDSGDIKLSAKMSLSSTWNFIGDIGINGNGNVLDLSRSGVLTIRPGSSLSLENIVVKGLGSGKGNIDFMGDDSVLRLSNVYFELDNNFSTTIGGILVSGEATIGLKNYNWTLDQNASMTINGATVWKDPLGSATPGDIVFGPGSLDKYLTLVSSGTIKTVSDLSDVVDATIALQQGLKTNSNTIMSMYSGHLGSAEIIPLGGALQTSVDVVYNGSSSFVQFSGNPNTVQVAAGKTMIFEDVILKDFGPQCFVPTAGGSMLFGSGTIIQLSGDMQNGSRSIDLNYTWTFVGDGNIVIDGGGKVLNFNTANALSIMSSGTVTLENCFIKGLGKVGIYPIQCINPHATVAFKNVTLSLYPDSAWSFSSGYLDLLENVEIIGRNSILAYTSPRSLGIGSDSTVLLDSGVTFSYDSAAGPDAMIFTDNSSTLYMKGSSLYVTNTGLRLTKGSIVIDDATTFVGEVRYVGLDSVISDISVGSNDAAQDANFMIMSGASLNVGPSAFIYQNMLPGSWIMNSINSTLRINAGGVLQLDQPMILGDGRLQLSTQSTLRRAVPQNLVGSVEFFE